MTNKLIKIFIIFILLCLKIKNKRNPQVVNEGFDSSLIAFTNNELP